MKRNYEIIVAAGSGSRYGGTLPKQFCDLAGRPLLMTTVERMRESDPGAEIVLVLSAGMIPVWHEMCESLGFESPRLIACGGATRAESVRNAMALVDVSVARRVGVHDGARPVITRDLVKRLDEAIDNGADGAIPAVAVTDSLRRLNADGSSEAVDRSRFMAVQTPQFFRADRLAAAYAEFFSPSATDDASLMEAAGFTDLRLVRGSPHNIKVTNPGDIAIAEIYLADC